MDSITIAGIAGLLLAGLDLQQLAVILMGVGILRIISGRRKKK